MTHIMDRPLTEQDRKMIAAEYDAQTQTPYNTDQYSHLDAQSAAEQAAIAQELRAIRLAKIEDQIRAAEERGREAVHLMTDDAWWLVRLVEGER